MSCIPRCGRPVAASLALSLAYATLLSVSVGAQLPRFVNCGDDNGFGTSTPGYELLGEGVAPAGISLSPPPIDTVHVAANFPSFWGTLPRGSDVLSIDPDQLDQTQRFTSLWLANNTTLAIAGLDADRPYRVRLLLGTLAPWGELTDIFDPPHWTYLPNTSRDVRVELRNGAGGWRTAASGIRCVSAATGNTFSTFLGGQVALWVLARSDSSGKLQLRLSTDSSDPVFLSAFELHDHEPLPIFYQRTAGEMLVGTTPSVAPFVAAFNAGDLNDAEALAFGLADPFERGVALLHLTGWLDGSMHGRLHLTSAAHAALLADHRSHPAAAWLLDELSSFERALAHLAASGFESAQKCPEDGGTGFLNTACGDQSSFVASLTHTNGNAHIALRQLAGMTAAVNGASVLNQLSAWNAGGVNPGDWEPSPLVFAAAKLSGTTMVSMNPSTKTSGSDPGGVAFAAQRDALVYGFVDLGFAASHFPDDMELLLFRHWLVQGKLPAQWQLTLFENLLTPAQIDASWWGPRVALAPDDPEAPEWANLQRQQQDLMGAVASYWLEERRDGGALGGGLGDDVELLAQFGKAFAGLQDQSQRRALDALDDITRWVLDGSGEVQEGYFSGGMADVQHTAEYTTNTFLTTLAAFGHTATAAELALASTQHLLHAQTPELAFGGDSNLGRTHFKSFVFTTNGHGGDPDHAWDTLLNGRAMYPGVSTSARAPLANSHPMVADLLSWADGWRDDALDTSGSKPAGWYGPAGWPTNAQGNGFWWNHTGTASDTAELSAGVHSYTLDLLRVAYQRSSSPDRWRYLLPAVRILRSVMDWEDAGLPANPPQGGDLWAASKLKSNSRFGGLVLAHLGELATDADLNTRHDPLNPSSTYVDADLIARMENWVEIEFNGQPAGLRYALGDLQPCNAGFTAKPTAMFTGNYKKILSYYRQLYPLLTTGVIHTDRINLSFNGGGPSNLLAAANGEDLVEGIVFRPLVRWRSLAGQSLDLAVQCNARGYVGSYYTAFTYNFGAAPLTAVVQLDQGLAAGEYQVEWGAANSSCDVFPSGAITNTMTLQKRGVGTQFELPVEPGLSLVRISRLGAADLPAAGYDLAVDTPSARLVDAVDGLRLELEARVVNVGRDASPGATLKLFATPMEPDGSLTLGGTEILLGSWSVPPLAGAASSWTLDGFTGTFSGADLKASSRQSGPHGAGTATGASASTSAKAVAPAGGIVPLGNRSLPFAQELADLVLAGQGLQLRAEIVADGMESDLLNNAFTRGWLLEDMPLVSP